MYRQLRVGVVMPAFNEEGAVARAVRSVPSFVDWVIVVDDASSDATAQRAQSVERDIELVRHERNRGVGAAIVSGYRRALELNLDVAVVMAGDGQMDPEDMPALLDPIAEGRADYVKGNRFAHRAVWTEMPPTRLLGNIVLSMATRATTGYRHIFDSQCGYTAITGKALRTLELHRVFARYGYPNDLLGRLGHANQRVVDVPVRPIYGPAWRSGVRWHTAVYPISYLLVLSWLRRLRAQAGAGESPPAPERRPARRSAP
jgi:glycosyltransferase involved in cell wall biosynthesis